MDSFDFKNPVKILFGKGKIAGIGQEIAPGSKVMLLYGSGSIKRNGIYDQVMDAVKEFDIVEFGGIKPNPDYETLMEAIAQAKKEKVDFLLSVGGGSVLDGTKFIAAGVFYEGNDPWEILYKGAKVTKALPIGCVLTLPATGSEMNGNAVISRLSTKEKFAFSSAQVFPKFSVLDPETTFSLPKKQVSNGIIDAFIHVTEQYLTYPNNTPVQDRFAESLLVTLIEEGAKANEDKAPDYETRANLMWAATMALNGLIGCGTLADWATHEIGHELTALHGLDHAVTLAIVWPGLQSALLENRKVKLAQFAERVWGITDGDEIAKAKLGVEKTEAFFRQLGVLTKLGEHEIKSETVDKIVERFKSRGVEKLGGQQDISIELLRLILESRL